MEERLVALLIRKIPEPVRRKFRGACVVAGRDMTDVLREYMRRVGDGEEKLEQK